MTGDRDGWWTGDGAPTPLNPPQHRRSKADPTIAVLGALQELSAAIGLVRSHLRGVAPVADFDGFCVELQRQLYVLKADLATATDDRVIEGKVVPRPDEGLIATIDAWIATHEAELGKPDCFVMEGGHPAAAAAMLANEVDRRAERLVTELAGAGADDRLSARLGLLGRWLNHTSYALYLLGRLTNRRLGIPEDTIFTMDATGEVVVQQGSFRPTE